MVGNDPRVAALLDCATLLYWCSGTLLLGMELLMSTGATSVGSYMRELLPHSIRYRFTDSVPNPPRQQGFEDINITADYNSTEEFDKNN